MKSGARTTTKADIGPIKRLVAVGLAVTLGFSALFWKVLDDMGRRDLELARVGATNLLATMGSEITRNVEVFDLSLQAVVDGLDYPYLDLLAPELRHMVLFDRSASANGIGAVLIVNEDGRVTDDSTRRSSSDENFSGRDFFEVHRIREPGSLFVSRPFVYAGEPVIAFSRRISYEGGDFRGAVVGLMKLSYFLELFRKPSQQANDAITLVREDGTLVMRTPYDPNMIGRDISRSEIFRRIRAEGSGSFEAAATLDGKQRLYTFQRLNPLPLYLTYGLSTDRLYAEWKARAAYMATIFGALCLVNVTLIFFLARSLRQKALAERALQDLVVTDRLTGLRNRRGLDEAVDVEWRRAARDKTPLSLVMIDADHFKAFNDRFGHQAGDVALASLAGCIARSARRAGDCAARYGGEEFALLLPNTDADNAVRVAHRIRESVSALRAAQAGRADAVPTVSIGVSTFRPRAGIESAQMFEAADAALYRAKEQGRDRVVVSEPPASRLKVA